MFMFPEPPPIDYYLADVSRSYLTDGIFQKGAGPTHKYVGKHLRPIKRTLNDPVAPIEQLDPRTLERWLEKEKGGYLDKCVKEGKIIHEIHHAMPRPKFPGKTKKPVTSIFPRSTQYEYWYIRDKRVENFHKTRLKVVERSTIDEDVKSTGEPCAHMKPPFWWKGETERSKNRRNENINDYGYESLKELDAEDTKISEKLDLDHPSKYMPGAIYRTTHPEDTSMKDVLDRADSFKVVLRDEENLQKDSTPADEHVFQKRVEPPACKVDSREDRDVEDAYGTHFDTDRRWRPPHKTISSPRTDEKRQEELRELTKPFLHDLHTWYSKNKPTKMFPPVKTTGKRPILEMRFSHL